MKLLQCGVIFLLLFGMFPARVKCTLETDLRTDLDSLDASSDLIVIHGQDINDDLICEVDEAVLRNLLGQLFLAQEEALKFFRNSSESNTYSINNNCGSSRSPMGFLKSSRSTQEDIPDRCVWMVESMGLLVANITREIQLLVEAALFDPSEYVTQIIVLEQHIMQLNEKMANLSIEHDARLEKLLKDFDNQRDCYLQLLDEKIAELEKMKARYEDKMVELIVANLKLSEYGDVELDWNDLNNDAFIPRIIQDVYDLKYYEQMANFALLMRKSSQRIDIYLKWYELMQFNNHLGEWKIIILRKFVHDEVNELGSQAPENLCILKSQVDTNAAAIFSSWGTLIRASNYDAIVAFGSPARRELVGYCFQDCLAEVINGAYQSRSNLGILIKFVFALRWNVHRATGLSTLNSHLSSDQDKLFIALKVKQALESLDGPDPPTQPRQTLESLRNDFKQQIRNIIWHNSCSLYNTHYGNYLYVASSQYEFESNHRRVLCWTPGIETQEARFRFLPVESSDYVYFDVQNTFYPSKLNAYEDDKDNRYFVSSSSSVSDRWRLEMVGNDQVRLWNSWKPAYLYASSIMFMDDRRYVYLWLPGSATVESTWRLSCY